MQLKTFNQSFARSGGEKFALTSVLDNMIEITVEFTHEEIKNVSDTGSNYCNLLHG